MKKLLFLLLIVFTTISCQRGEEPFERKPSDQTSFVLTTYAKEATISNLMAGYYDENGVYKKISDIETVNYFKHTKEIIIENDTLTYIHILRKEYDYCNDKYYYYGTYISFKLERNRKNVFEVHPDMFFRKVTLPEDFIP